jgi:PAS domain S-box-containing protein
VPPEAPAAARLTAMQARAQNLRELPRGGEAYRFLFSDEDEAVVLFADVIEDCNEAACRMLGRTRDQVIGRSPLDFSPAVQPDGTPSAQLGRQRVESGLAGLPQWYRWQYLRKDGTPLEALVHEEVVRVDGRRRVLIRSRDLSDLQRTESALRETEMRLQQIIDNTTAVVFAKDDAGRYLIVNREFERLVGAPRTRIIGRTDLEIFDAGMAERLQRNDRRVMHERRSIEFEEQIVFEGERLTYLASKFPLLGANGEAYALCGIATDITARKRTEEALRAAALAVSGAEGAEVFEGLAARLAEILRVDLGFIARFADGSRSHMRMLAFHLDGRLRRPFTYALEGTPCAEVVGREFRFVALGASAQFSGDDMFAKLGLESYAAYPLNDAAGRPLGLIGAMDRRPMRSAELTEAILKIFAMRAAAEIERALGEEALRASEASYRAIFEASEDTIFVHDWDSGAILEVNAKASALYGYSAEELPRITIADLSARDSSYTEERAARLIEQAKAQAAPLRFEWRARHKDGHAMWHEVTLKAATIAGHRRLLAFVRDITERKAADEALRASEEQYREIFNATADGLVLRDAQFRIVDLNPAFSAMTGYERDEVVGSDRVLAIDQASAERPLRALHERALEGERIHLELPGRRKDGSRVELEVRGVPVQYRRRPHVLFMVRDVTARKRADEALRRSEELLRTTVEAAFDPMVSMDAQGRIIDFNPAAERCFGHARAAVLGRTLAEVIIPPRYREAHAAGLARWRQSGGSALLGRRVEMHAMRADASEFPVELAVSRAQGREGEIFVGYLRDITERKAADEALRASEEQYRAVFNATADSLVLRDARFRVADVNPAFCAMTGYRREEVIAAGHTHANPPHLDDLLRSLHRRALAGETVLAETEGVRRDGSRFDLELRAGPIRYRGARHVLFIGRNISERKRAEAERLAFERQLRQAQKMEAIGQLTGGIAHDFNNLLASIMGYVVLAAEREATGADAKLARYLDEALASCRRARDLIQQMLTFSRGQRSEPRPLSLAQAVDDAMTLLRSSLPSSVEMRTSLDRDAPAVLLDPVQLDQVLLNLCINARDAMAGHGSIGIRVARTACPGAACASCRQSFAGEFVELSVEDSGTGIAPEVLERMFEPFFSTKEIGRGSGMGLATVHGIVHEHGGHIVVEAAPGKGSRFRILMPLLEAPAQAARADAAPRIAVPRARLRGRVMVIDDEESVAEFMRELLEGWGLAATAHNSPARAREAFGADPAAYDLVITDHTMPGITGFSLARELLARRPDLPIILYTGHAERVTQREIDAAGIRALLHKPVEPDALYGLLKTHLN